MLFPFVSDSYYFSVPNYPFYFPVVVRMEVIPSNFHFLIFEPFTPFIVSLKKFRLR